MPKAVRRLIKSNRKWFVGKKHDRWVRRTLTARYFSYFSKQTRQKGAIVSFRKLNTTVKVYLKDETSVM